MKFSKDQIQKAVLMGMLGLGILYYYCFELLGPLAVQEAKATKEIAALNQQIAEAKPKIARTKSIEAGDPNATAARKTFEVMRAKIPTGEPVAWFPTRLTDFFRRQGITKPNFHCNPEPGEPEFPGFKASFWVIDLPEVAFATFGNALAHLENQEGLMQITNLQIDTVSKEPENHHVRLIVSTLVKSEK